MKELTRRICLAVSICTIVACGGDDSKSSDDKKGTSEDPQGQAGDDSTGTDLTGTAGDSSPDNEGTAQSESGSETDGKSTPTSAECCNNVVDEGEDCDDGCNDDDNDGCTKLCAYSCKADEDCGDEDVCNGQETCDTATHMCQEAAEFAENGEGCGAGKACIKGECTDISCNTSEDCVGECDPLATCNTDTGACEPGRPIAEDTVCNNGDGYCQAWICVPNTCGDGEQEPNEECDLGEDNGTEGGGCTEECTKFVCGDGKIDGKEQCDDGNRKNMDGCDKHCRLELVYRLNKLVITTDPAPELCEFADSRLQGNSMAKAFPKDPTMLEMMRTLMNSSFENGTINYMMYIFGMDDPSAKTEDKTISLGQMQGILAEDWDSQTDKLDFPMKGNIGDMDDNNNPNLIMPVELVIDGDTTTLQTTHPITLRNQVEEGDFTLYKVVSAMEVDPPRSAVENSNGVEVPESFGNADGNDPTGFMCGAIPVDAMAGAPLPQSFADICLEEYRGCAEDEEPPDCDSIQAIMEGGCTSRTTRTVIMDGMGGPDADVDGDGELDGYSMVIYHSAKRVKIVGTDVMPPREPGCQCGCLCESCNESWSCQGADCAPDPNAENPCEAPCAQVCTDNECGALSQGVGVCTGDDDSFGF